MCVCTGECVQVCAHMCVYRCVLMSVWGCANAFPPCWVEVTAEKVISQGPSLSDPSWHPPHPHQVIPWCHLC